MRSYLILFTLSLLISCGLTPLVRGWALRYGAVDWPDGGRRIHRTPTARLGGVAIYLAFLITLALAPWLGTLVSQSLLSSWRNVGMLLAAGTLIFALGVYDDFRGTNATVKFAVQLIAAALLYAGGFHISVLSSPFGGGWELPAVLSFPLTALWIVGITNAFNLIDGIDGLAAGASAFALLSLFLCSLAQSHPEVSVISIILVGAVIGFLRYNFNPATIFLGDSGSLLLGFMAAVLSLVGAQKSPTLIAIAIPLISFGLPVAEVSLSLSRRFVSGAPLFQGDRRHIHHMLLQRGLTQRQTVILLYAICALFSLFGLMLLNPHRNKVALVLFVLGVGIVLGVHQLRYAEFDALGLTLKRGVTRSKRSLTASARWLVNLENLRAARTWEELLSALAVICETQGLVAARLEFWPQGQPGIPAADSNNEWAFAAKLSAAKTGQNGYSTQGAGRKADQLTWAWPRAPRENAFRDEEGLMANCWSLRLPLIGSDGRNMGAFTLYQSLTNSAASGMVPLDLTQTTDLLSGELSTALNSLFPHQASEYPKATEEYMPNFKRDRAAAAG